jgi:HEPN domain-containing protein
MDQAKRDLVRAWLIKARNDLVTARELGAMTTTPLDTAIYHCQQAAEKAVKGFLAFHDHPLERTHDVERLVELAQRYESNSSTRLMERLF